MKKALSIVMAAMLIMTSVTTAAFCDDVKLDCESFCEAVRSGTPETVQYMIDAGSDINERDNNGWTALLHAANLKSSSQKIAMLETLVKAGADINIQNDNGETALMLLAKFEQNPKVVQVLLNARADIDARDNNGWTALMWASQFAKTIELVQVFLKHGADVNARDYLGATVLMNAARGADSVKILEILIKAGAKVDTWDNEYKTPLDYLEDDNLYIDGADREVAKKLLTVPRSKSAR